MATITDNNSHPEQRDATRALRDELANLSLGGVADSMRASRYAVSAVDGGNVPTLVGAQVGGNTGTGGLPRPVQIVGRDSVQVAQTANLATVQLVGDSATPAKGAIYGASTAGALGYQAISTLVTAGTNITVTVNADGSITVASTGGGGAPLVITTTTAAEYTIPLSAAPASASNRGWVEQQSGTTNYVDIDANIFPVGTDIFISQGGSGATTIKALPGVTFTGPTITGGGRYSVGRATQLSTNNWRITGDLAFLTFSNYSTTILADTPVAYWHLGEASGTVAADSSGNSYNGTYTGTYTQHQPSILPSGYGNSLLLAGAGHVVTPSTTALAGISAPVSLEGWVYFTTIPTASEVIIALCNGGPQVAISSSTAGHLTFGYSGVVNGTESSGLVSVNTKTHVVVTVSSTGAISYYINGASAGTGTVSVHTGSGSGAIGTYPLGGFSLSGSVQEIAVYNYVLTAAQVSSHYSAGL